MSLLGLQPGATIAEAKKAMGRAFRVAGLHTPDLDARILLGHVLGLDRSALAATDRILDDDAVAGISAVTARRLGHEPVARIVGRKEFWGLSFELGPHTLVPRPETETIVETVLGDIGIDRGCALRIADLGTGSGALLLALLSELPAAYGVGTDLSLEALHIARKNAATLGFAGRSSFVRCDYGAALAGSFDVIVSNPPYVRRDDIATLDADVREHDPRLALDGGLDGLDGYRAIAADARRLLVPDARLAIEIGLGQEASVSQIMAAVGMTAMTSHADLAGVTRTLLLHAP